MLQKYVPFPPGNQAGIFIRVCRNIGVHTKPLNGVSIRKNVSCGSIYNMKAEKCTTLIHESSAFQLFIFHI